MPRTLNPNNSCCQVVALCGDGGFMMNSQELETAVRMGLHIVVVVVTDSGYGMIKWKRALTRPRARAARVATTLPPAPTPPSHAPLQRAPLASRIGVWTTPIRISWATPTRTAPWVIDSGL